MIRKFAFLLLVFALVPIGITAQQQPPPIITPETPANLPLAYTLDRHNRAITSLVFTEEYALNSTGMDNWWYVWNLANGQLSTPQRNVFGRAIFDFAVEIDPEEEVINALSVQRRGQSNLVVATTTNQLTILPFDNAITDVQLTTDMAQVFSATEDGTVALWNVENGEQAARWTLESAATRLHIAEDNTTFTAVTGDGVYRLMLGDEALALYATEGDVIAGDVAETTDGIRAVLALSDGTLVTVDTTADDVTVLTTVADVGEMTAAALSASGELVAATVGETVQVYAVAGDGSEPLITLNPDDGGLTHLTFSPEDIWLVTGGERGNVYVYSLPTE